MTKRLPTHDITVALDVDGVVFPFVDPQDPLFHERATNWSFAAPEGELSGSVLAHPLLATLFDLGGICVRDGGGRDGAVAAAVVTKQRCTGTQVLWHTSRQLEASEVLAPQLGLDFLTGGREKHFATRAEYLGEPGPSLVDADGDELLERVLKNPTVATSSTWWKLAAVQRWLHEHPIVDGHLSILVWIDDDIQDAIRSGEIPLPMLRDPRLVLISPHIHTGINPAELTLLRQLTHLD